MMLKSLCNTILSAFFPNTCVSCGCIINEKEYLCDYCHEMIERCNSDLRCIKCGQAISECECNKRKYSFSGCLAPYYNTDIAKKIMYSYKFSRKIRNCDFFAYSMAIAVKNEFRNINFNGICYVPISKKRSLKRGYNQSRLIALKMSKILNIPLIDNALSCKNTYISQHDMPLKKRFENVKGLYSYNYLNKNRTLLLIDDIKTTGATLDECSRQLLKSGAKNVFCATGLITRNTNGI